MNHTEDTLLDGRIRYRQQIDGHRTGIEPILLAAAVPARPGQRVIEAGTGAGAALLCLNHRVAGLRGVGVELDPQLAALAADNLCANGVGGIRIVAADIVQAPLVGPFDHAFANPPWRALHDTQSPDPGRRLAYGAGEGLLQSWIQALAGLLRHRGSLTLVLPASSIDEALPALSAARCGSTRILPLWPRTGKPAKLMLLYAMKHGRNPSILLPGLVLHDGRGYTDAASRILRDGLSLEPTA